MEYWKTGKQQEQSFISFEIYYSIIPAFHGSGISQELLKNFNFNQL
jgi:hypothetical protein